MKKKLISLLTVVTMLCALAPFVHAAKIVDSGSCGASVTWTLDSEGTLTISGTGEMEDYNHSNSPFYSNSNIKTIIIENGVTSIGKMSFAFCKNLTSVTIPDSVAEIDSNAFIACMRLTGVTIPDSVTDIGFSAFRYCEKLTSVTIGNSVTAIGTYAFDGCESLTNVTIPDSVTNIGYGAFSCCKSLTNIQVNENNKNYCSVDGSLFNKAKTTLIRYASEKDDSSYIIPNGVTRIGEWAFSSRTNLTSVTIPDSVTRIDDNAFSFCSGLTSITIPGGVTRIGEWAFSDCTSLSIITIPDSVTYIGYKAFDGCKSLASVYYGGSAENWHNITIDERSENLTNAEIFYNVTSSDPPQITALSAENNNDGTYNIDVALDSVNRVEYLIAALYNGGVLTGIEQVKLVPHDTAKTVTVTADTADAAKVFVWDSLNGMRPLCEAKKTTI